jgi:hypothetical protein
MGRVHLFEFEDLPWFPSVVRGYMTDYLSFMGSGRFMRKPYLGFAERLAKALRTTGEETIVDLCSGGGGPSLTIQRVIRTEFGRAPRLVLTDLYPNLAKLEFVQREAGEFVAFEKEPVNAARVPERLAGFRLICNGFHHLSPELARNCLQDAVEQRRGIAIVELANRSALTLLEVAAGVSTLLLVTPFIRPFRLSRLLLTYALPIVPMCTLWDGIVSCLRAYEPVELQTIVDSLAKNDYEWDIGRLPIPNVPAKVTYLIGYPRVRSHHDRAHAPIEREQCAS